MAEESVPDPLTSFIARSLRAQVNEVTEVREEVLRRSADAELERVHFIQGGARRTLIVKRVPSDRSLEVRLLPHLARKTDRVPVVHARGIPPAAVPAWPWLLIEDLVDAPLVDDPVDILEAKVAVERAVRSDGPALVALGVPRIAREGPLAGWPEVIVHGALTGANAVRTDRGVVLTEWGQAELGRGLTDIVRLARAAGVPSRGLAERYAAASGVVLTEAALEAAEDLL